MRNVLIILLLFSSCKKQEFKDINEYYKWSGDPENNITKSFKSNDYNISVRYLIPDYLAYKETCNNNFQHYDSLRYIYSNSLSFIVTFEDNHHKSDPVMNNSESFEQFKTKIYNFNFHAAEYVSLTIDGHEFSPVLFTFENGYDMDTRRSFYVVFDKKAGDIVNTVNLNVDDQIFYSGLHHFQFNMSDIKNNPEFSFIKK